jgi:hypothetical protein
MKVVICGPAAGVSIEEAEDLDHLSVVLEEVSPERAGELLGDLGRIEGHHAWLNIDTLLAVSPKPRSCSWDERFAKMVAYAKKSGWTDAGDMFLRAHVEPTNAQV